MRVLHVYTRHLKRCVFRKKGPYWPKCGCPKWVSGTIADETERRRKSLNTSDWVEAERLVVNMERGLGIYDSKELPQAISTWKASLSVGPATQRKYFRLLRQIEEWAKSQEIKVVADLTLERLDKFYEEHAPGKHTKLREVQTLRQFFAFCMERHWCETNPAKKIKTPKGIKPNEVIPYTDEEIVRMIAACDRIGDGFYGPGQFEYERRRARAMILLLRETGLRLGDAFRLRKDAVRNGVLTLHTQKTAHPIVATLSRQLQFALEALPSPLRSKPDCPYFFWNGYISKHDADGGAKGAVNKAHRLLAPVFKAAGILKGHAHRFRHTLATRMLAEGATMADVALTLGNTVGVCERVYAKYDTARAARADDFRRKALGGTYKAREEENVLEGHTVDNFAGAGGGSRTV